MLQCSMMVALGSHAAGEPRQRASSVPGITPGPFPRRLASLINWPGLVPGPFSGPGHTRLARRRQEPVRMAMRALRREQDAAGPAQVRPVDRSLRHDLRRYRGKLGLLAGPSRSRAPRASAARPGRARRAGRAPPGTAKNRSPPSGCGDQPHPFPGAHGREPGCRRRRTGSRRGLRARRQRPTPGQPGAAWRICTRMSRRTGAVPNSPMPSGWAFCSTARRRIATTVGCVGGCATLGCVTQPSSRMSTIVLLAASIAHCSRARLR